MDKQQAQWFAYPPGLIFEVLYKKLLYLVVYQIQGISATGLGSCLFTILEALDWSQQNHGHLHSSDDSSQILRKASE